MYSSSIFLEKESPVTPDIHIMRQNIRNPVAVLLLSIVTCGIYGLYTVYKISLEVSCYNGDHSVDPALEVVLCIVTCGIYNIYWTYKYAKLINGLQIKTGVPYPSDISLPALLLSVFGFFVVSLMLLQTELNKVWEQTPLA